ncbi:MAG: hypothetical protein WBG71_08395 [Leeuwenhoekiella sp.]
MKINWFYIKMISVLALTGFLYGFSHQRNIERRVGNVQVRFAPASGPFMTAETVDKLLIQNNQALSGQAKETLDLKVLEDRLDAHPMVYNAEVYLSLDGQLGAIIKQREPLARVSGKPSFYLDNTGTAMPLSGNFAARVPLVSGVDKKQLADVYKLMKFLKRDEFLSKQVVGIDRQIDGDYLLKLRALDYDLLLGTPTDLDRKFSNYKAFYKQAEKEQALTNYKTIDVRFKGQVVGIKS